MYEDIKDNNMDLFSKKDLPFIWVLDFFAGFLISSL